MGKREKNTMDITLLRELISYNPETGVFVWKKTSSNRAISGEIAGSISKTTGYRYIRVMGKSFPAARIAWAIVNGEFPSEIVDHISKNRGDDRYCNFRLADQNENAANSLIHKDNSSGYKGVEFHRETGKWRARICKFGRRTSLGLFSDPKDAHAAYLRAAWRIHGEFATGGYRG